MIYSRTCGYAIQAVTRLAMLRPRGYILLEELCDGTDLPRAFVAKILRILVREGILISAKGRCGGFALARPPETIRIFDIVRSIDGTADFQQCIIGKSACQAAKACPLHERWCAIRNEVETYLTTTTLEDTSRTLASKGAMIPTPLVVKRTARGTN